MTQPTRWGSNDEPDAVVGQLPKERADLYRLIWHTSLACAMEPPVLRHVRALWKSPSGILVAVASVSALNNREGYWLERRDHPRIGWPTGDDRPTLGGARVLDCNIRDRRHPSPGQMIQGVFDSGIATPASIVALFQRLLGRPTKSGQEAPGALVQFVCAQDRKIACLTEFGAASYERWREAGAVGQVQARNETLAQLERDEIGYRDALSALVGDAPELSALADTVARQIDQLCERWRGMSREATLNEMAKVAHRPPRFTALPAWMDPEKRLPAEHPLREWRQRMEASLAQSDPAWTLLSAQQRAQRRFAWLQAHAAEISAAGGGEAFSAAMNEETGRFSALRYWLTGLSTEKARLQGHGGTPNP